MSTQQSLTLLGATGSIGKSTLDVVARHPDRFRLHALTAHTAADALLEICVRHRPALAILSGREEDRALRAKFEHEAGTELRFGAAALDEVAAGSCDTVMAAIVGGAGLAPTIAAVHAGKRVLLANKEALVMAGPLFMGAARRSGATLVPVDSEHNAVFQCLPTADQKARGVRRIVLTASGGPFRATPLERLARVTPDEACAHPNWVMGRKISVDSATMMNKGLEVIEARWLFDLPASCIEVVIHPQSIVHSMVEYADGSMLAQLSNPDMRVPIAHALGFPERIESGARWLDLAATQPLSFEKPDELRFPCLALAREALAEEGIAPAVLNAANEVAVAAFLAGRLGFMAIADVISDTRSRIPPQAVEGIAHVREIDARARAIAMERIAAGRELAA
jgi:1-deoxy-D-xylulose-5-phosphate reductoisomerase